MIRWFKRRRPMPVQPTQISPEDRLMAALNGYTPDQWNAMPALVKADMRENIVNAPRFQR